MNDDTPKPPPYQPKPPPYVPKPQSSTPPGWYPANDMVNTLRYWDGNDWTDQTTMMPPPQHYQQPTSSATIALGVAGGIALVLVILVFLGGGFEL